jgi:hypothetical protein
VEETLKKRKEQPASPTDQPKSKKKKAKAGRCTLNR